MNQRSLAAPHWSRQPRPNTPASGRLGALTHAGCNSPALGPATRSDGTPLMWGGPEFLNAGKREHILPEAFVRLLLASHEVSVGEQVKVNGQLGQSSVLNLPDFGDILPHLLSLRIHIVVADHCASPLTLCNHLLYSYSLHSLEERNERLNDGRFPCCV